MNYPDESQLENSDLTCQKDLSLVLDVLSSQLGETARQVEQSITQVCTSFASIASRTKANAALTVKSSNQSEGSEGNVLATARSTIAEMLGRMDQVRKATDEAIETFRRLEGISTQVDQIEIAIDEVDVVAHTLRILALNARIEAVRAGTRGAAFGVVANETVSLADSVGKTAKSVRVMVKRLWKEVQDSTKRMRSGLMIEQNTDDLKKATELSNQEGTRALDALTKANADMQNQVAQAASYASRLAEDISDAMTALQFQDSVNQQIEHVISALHETRDALRAGDTTKAGELLNRLRSRTSMESERVILDKHFKTDYAQPEQATCSVELF